MRVLQVPGLTVCNGQAGLGINCVCGEGRGRQTRGFGCVCMRVRQARVYVCVCVVCMRACLYVCDRQAWGLCLCVYQR